MTWSERILQAVDRIPGEHRDRQERYRTWSMQPSSAETLLKTLLALGIHALVLDAVAEEASATEEHRSTEQIIQRIHLADVENAVTRRPSHELLAGLPPLGDEEQLRVNALRVLIYDDASALPLARLSQMIRISLLNLAAQFPVPDPTCADVIFAEPAG